MMCLPLSKSSRIFPSFVFQVFFSRKLYGHILTQKLVRKSFPIDLQRVALEKAQKTRSEHYTFTMTDSAGQRVYGICMRILFRGVTRRFDVKRRVRHCLCVITRYPFFKFFKTVLMELHAVAMLEEKPGCCRQFIDCIYRMSDLTSGREQRLTIPVGTISAMYAEYSLLRPKVGAGGGMSSKDVPILPLFDTLGTERFFKLLSAVLCERRIVFVAEEAETLSATVLAAASMLHPFKWHHVFIPLLPGKLLSLLQSQVPYMIGVRKYLLSELRRDSLDGTVVVDCDSGDVRLQGQVYVRDLIGDSASARKQASESLDQMKAKVSGMASMFMGKNSGDSSQDHSGPKDLMVVLLSDLKSAVTSTKPSSYTISSLLSGGVNRSLEEAKTQWAVDAEKAVRDNITCFFVYFFADLDEYMSPAAAIAGGTSTGGFGTVKTASDHPAAKRMAAISSSDGTSISGSVSGGGASDIRDFPPGDSRAYFDLKAYVSKRAQQGDSKHLVSFLVEFVHSQMFERFCGELVLKKQAQIAKQGDMSMNKRKSMTGIVSSQLSSAGNSAGRGGVNSLPNSLSGSALGTSAATGGDEEQSEDSFERACLEWSQRGQALTIANTKLAVSASNLLGKELGSNGFHNLAVQFTSGSTPLVSFEADIDHDNQYYTSHIGVSNASTADSSASREAAKRSSAVDGVLRRILADCSVGDEFISIMRTIHFRLQGSLATGGRGSSGIAGVRALILCRSLLIEGPECVLTYALDFIPILRTILRLSQSLDSGSIAGKSKQQQAIDYMSLGAFVDPTVHAQTVLDLIIDHKKLTVQRKVAVLLKKNSFPFLTTPASNRELRAAQYVRTEMFFSASFSASKLFPKFDSLHHSLNPLNLTPVGPNVLQLTAPELAVGAVEDRLTGNDEDDDNLSVTPQQQQGSNSPGPRGSSDRPFANSSCSNTPPPAPSALASYTNAQQSRNTRNAAGAANANATPPVKSTRERFIYDDDDDTQQPAPPTTAAAASKAVKPEKPGRPDSGRTVSPFRGASGTASATTASASQKTSPFAPSQPAAAAAVDDFAPSTFATAVVDANSSNNRRQSTSTVPAKLAPPPEGATSNRRASTNSTASTTAAAAAAAKKPTSAGDLNLLDMDLLAPPVLPAAAAATPVLPTASSTLLLPDPFGADPFMPSFPTAAPTQAQAATVDNSDFVASRPDDGFTPSFPSIPKAASAPAINTFKPSTSWDMANTNAAFTPSVPAATHKPAATAAAPTDAFVPSFPSTATTASAAVAPMSNDDFTPSFPSTGLNNPAPAAATGAGAFGGGSFIYTKPPPGAGRAQQPADPFDFLNPIKK